LARCLPIVQSSSSNWQAKENVGEHWLVHDKRANRKLTRYAGLQELEIGVILYTEHIDVRRILLADSPTAPTPGRSDSFQFRFSHFEFRS
jgi:hypothetical protein